MKPIQTENKAVLYASLAVICWSTVATAFKIALTYLSHYEMLLVACLTSLVLFSMVLTFQHKWHLVFRLTRRQWLSLAGIGFLNPFAYYLVLFKAYDLLPAQVAQPVNYAWPIFLVILLAIFAGQPIPKRKYIGMFVSLCGVVLISAGSSSLGNYSISAGGMVLDLFSAVIWATYWMVNNRKKDHTDGSVTLFVTFLFAFVYLLIGCSVVPVHLSALPGILSGMYVGLFEMGLPFIFFSLALRKTTNPTLINQMCYFAPFLSLFLISAILGERIVFTTYIGLFLIILGITFNQFVVSRRKKAACKC